MTNFTPQHAGFCLPAGLSRRFTLTLAMLAAALMGVQASDWPAWRGPSADGSISSGRYPVEWTVDSVAWKVPLPGKGSSSPIVWKDHIYLTTPVDGQDAVMAFDRQGREIWLTRLGPATRPKHRSLGSSSNASPVTDGNALFVYFKSGHFAAVELDGSVRWKLNLAETFGPERLFWDQGSSPVVVNDLVVLTRMHEGKSWVAGFDKATGTMQWQQPRDYDVPTENDNGYTTPLVFEHKGEKALLVWGADHLTAHSAKDGRVLWTCGGFNPDQTGYWPAIASPVIVQEMAIIPVGRDDRAGQASVHGIRLGGTGDVTQTHRAWVREDVGVFVPALAAYEGRVYLLRHRGEVVCLDPATGRTIWAHQLPEGRSRYFASPVIANGILYAAREDGMVFTARVGETLELLGRNDMGEQIIASPVPFDNRLLLRGDDHLFCVAR